MEDENATLRRLLADAEARAAAAEVEAEQSRATNLTSFLSSCHDFCTNISIITDKTLTTQGITTRPSGRLFPQQIVPWDDFAREQEMTWDKIATSADFAYHRVYPAKTQLDYVQRCIKPISTELGLRDFARETVENPVQTLIEEIHKDFHLRDCLQLAGTLIFESHTNLGDTGVPSIEDTVEYNSISEPHTPDARKRKHDVCIGRDNKKHIARGDSRAIRGNADQFCIYHQTDGLRIPVVLIEYKAPHKLPLNQIITGLRGEIRPAEEIIDKEGDTADFLAKSLLSAVVTQLFSSMIGKGVQKGYIFTGEATIFLYIPDDTSSVRYHLSIPSLDFHNDDGNRYHRTSVAQIAAFALGAVIANPPAQSWYDRAAELDVWAVEYIDILKMIPETDRKALNYSAYNAGRWKGFSRSPIRTRSRRIGPACEHAVDDHCGASNHEDDGNEGPSTPTPKGAPGRAKPSKSVTVRTSRVTRSSNKRDAASQDQRSAKSRPAISSRAYCTHQCLLGLASGGQLDGRCPNVGDHRGEHLQLDIFLSLLRNQLAKDRGPDADCQPLYIQGARGALLKLRLSSHGYTFVAKAMQRSDQRHLLRETSIYHRLTSLQGSHIPVCLGRLKLGLPYFHNYRIYFSMLLLSWAGQPLYECLNRENVGHMLVDIESTLRCLHSHQVLHRDAEVRNWVCDGRRVMLVDFERAEIRDRVPLQSLSHNQKREPNGGKSFVKDHDFEREIQAAKSWVLRSLPFNSTLNK